MLADLLISPLSSFLLVLLPCRDAAEAVAGRSVCFLQIVYSFVPLSERSCVRGWAGSSSSVSAGRRAALYSVASYVGG